MDVELNELEFRLLEKYASAYSEVPCWAFPVAPPIPFVGDRYPMAGGGILIYASAENLGYTWPKGYSEWNENAWKQNLSEQEWPWLASKQAQMTRSRLCHARFPGTTHVHIEPINNGSLLLASHHALRHLHKQHQPAGSSLDFLRQVAVANPGKFSIRSKRNIDYASKPRYWPDSLPFIRLDIEVLRPSVIVVPRTIAGVVRRAINGLMTSMSRPAIIPLFQITALTIRRNIKSELKARNAETPVRFQDPSWPLTRGAEIWGMEFYLQWIDLVACHWIDRPA